MPPGTTRFLRKMSAAVMAALCTGCVGTADERWLLAADRVFDGEHVLLHHALLIEGDLIVEVAPRADFQGMALPLRDLGDATLLPGFIEPHAHTTFREVPTEIVLRHGITSLRELGGPPQSMQGGQGQIRRLTAGPILTPTGGYPVPGMGSTGIAWQVDTPEQAAEAVTQLAEQGVSVIKVALEPGGESGAPWAGSHHASGTPPAHDTGHAHAAPLSAVPAATPEHAHPMPAHQGAWPLFSVAMVRAIVAQAGSHGLDVVAHVGEARGVEIALEAGVQQWAHVPCEPVPAALLERAAQRGVHIISTTDTLSRCPGVMDNLRQLATLGASLHYGSEIGHEDVPWGINGQELVNLVLVAGMTPLQAVQAATSRNGELLGLPLLGTLQAGAPADIIAAPGDPLRSAQTLKALEYPVLVVSGGELALPAAPSGSEP